LGAAAVSFREDHSEDKREEPLLGDPTKISDYQSVASNSTTDSFDVEIAIEKIKMQKKAMEQVQNGSQEGLPAIDDEESLRFAQFVAQMEHDFDGAILAMMETHSETASEGTNSRKAVEEEREEPGRGGDETQLQLPQLYPMETVEEEHISEHAEESRVEIYDDKSCNDDDSDFTPFSVSDFPSDESRAYSHSSQESDSVDEQRVLHYYNSPEVADLVSPLTDYGSRPPLSPVTDYGYNPYQENQEPSFEPCIDLDQFAATSLQAVSNEPRAKEATQHIVQHRVAVQHGTDDEYCYDDEYTDADDGNQWWGYFRKSKHPVTGASFVCLFHVLIQILAFRALLGLLMDYHQSNTNLLDPSGDLPLCQADSGCLRAIPVALNESGEHEVVATTKSMKQMNEIQNDACEGSWFQSPTLWYSLIGDGSKHTAIAFPTSEDFDVSIMVLEGRCNRPDFYYGPSHCCGQAGESSLVWDTVAGKEYFIAVFGAKPNSTGSFRMDMWNTQHTKDALTDHIDHRGVDSFRELAAGGSVGISMTFLAAAAFA